MGPLAANTRGLAAKRIARGVDHDPVEPRLELALAAPRRELGGQADADVLRQIGRVVGVAEHPDGDAVDPVVVAFQQRGERIPVPRRGPANQRGVGALIHVNESRSASVRASHRIPERGRADGGSSKASVGRGTRSAHRGNVQPGRYR